MDTKGAGGYLGSMARPKKLIRTTVRLPEEMHDILWGVMGLENISLAQIVRDALDAKYGAQAAEWARKLADRAQVIR